MSTPEPLYDRAKVKQAMLDAIGERLKKSDAPASDNNLRNASQFDNWVDTLLTRTGGAVKAFGKSDLETFQTYCHAHAEGLQGYGHRVMADAMVAVLKRPPEELQPDAPKPVPKKAPEERPPWIPTKAEREAGIVPAAMSPFPPARAPKAAKAKPPAKPKPVKVSKGRPLDPAELDAARAKADDTLLGLVKGTAAAAGFARPQTPALDGTAETGDASGSAKVLRDRPGKPSAPKSKEGFSGPQAIAQLKAIEAASASISMELTPMKELIEEAKNRAITLGAIKEAVCKRYKITDEELCSSHRQPSTVRARDVVVFLARATGEKFFAIAGALKKSGAVETMGKRAEALMDDPQELDFQRTVHQLLQQLVDEALPREKPPIRAPIAKAHVAAIGTGSPKADAPAAAKENRGARVNIASPATQEKALEEFGDAWEDMQKLGRGYELKYCMQTLADMGNITQALGFSEPIFCKKMREARSMAEEFDIPATELNPKLERLENAYADYHGIDRSRVSQKLRGL